MHQLHLPREAIIASIHLVLRYILILYLKCFSSFVVHAHLIKNIQRVEKCFHQTPSKNLVLVAVAEKPATAVYGQKPLIKKTRF